jgi:uroporphyrinogen III methyltransferase/synthase
MAKGIRLASLSPVTTEAARSVGWNIAVEALEYTWEGLVQSIVDQVARERKPFSA